MEKKNKKLQLNKETIRNLSDENLAQVAGGKKKDSDVLCSIGGCGSAVVGCSVVIGQSCAKNCH